MDGIDSFLSGWIVMAKPAQIIQLRLNLCSFQQQDFSTTNNTPLPSCLLSRLQRISSAQHVGTGNAVTVQLLIIFQGWRWHGIGYAKNKEEYKLTKTSSSSNPAYLLQFFSWKNPAVFLLPTGLYPKHNSNYLHLNHISLINFTLNCCVT